jgi:8-oxo-dGTP pyrophosphatase MutT (NUDIX family)
MSSEMKDFRELIIKKLGCREPKTLDFPNFKKSGVILIYNIKQKGDPFIFFERRQDGLRNHSGEISLPGGRIEPEDKTILDTVFRETKEELNIDKSKLEVLGRLDYMFMLTSKYIISTFVAEIKNFNYDEIKIEPCEVAEFFEVPVGAFLDENNFKERIWTFKGKRVPIYYYHYQNYIIWGATGYIINQFIRLLFDFNPSSIKDFHRTDPNMILNKTKKKLL